MKTKLLAISALCIAFASCTQDENNGNNAVEAIINATISDKSPTRAAGTTWIQADRIGITTTSNGLTRYTNIPYVYNGTKFEPDGSVIYFQDAEEVTFRAYYPFTGQQGIDPAEIEVSTNADKQTADSQPSIDFLFTPQAKASKHSPVVNFTGESAFSHCMSKLTITLTAGNGISFTDLEGYTIDDLKLNGTFNTADGTATAGTAAAVSLDISLQATTDKQCTSSLILLPQQVASGLPLTVHVDGQEYKATLEITGNELKPGNNYIFNATVNKTNIEVEKAEIVGWINISMDDINAQMQ